MAVSIIINPIAGGRAGSVGVRVDLARRIAAECGQAADVSITEALGHARELAKAARASGAARVVAWGGDGTINEVASVLSFSDVPLAIVPAGSGNGLARALALPTHPPEALRRAFTGAARPIDVGTVDDRLFVNLAGVGFDAHVAAQFNTPDNRRGPWRYVTLTARALFTYQPRCYEIVTDGQRKSVRALLVVIANGNEFGNRMLIAPGARVDDGALDLVVVEERSRAATICRVPWLVNRCIDRVPVWSSWRAQEAVIESEQPMLFHVDGESVQGGKTLRARVSAGALLVVT